MRLRDIFWIIDTKNSRALITKWAEKAGKDAEKVISYVEETYKETNDQLAAGKWICEGYEPKQFPQALYICKQKKLDPLKQNPDELVEKNPDVKPKDKPINPDTVLSDRQEDGEGNVTYAARDEDREVLRQLINTHYGIDANPWCLLAAENGKLTSDSERMWKRYNAYPKRVAFRDGKLLAFSAGTNENMREWWDRFDRSFPFIPYDGKRWLGKDGGTYEIRKGNVYKVEGDTTSRLSTSYSTDIEESDRAFTIDTQRQTITDKDGVYPYEEKDGKYVVTNGKHVTDLAAVTFTLNKDLELDGEYIEKNTYTRKLVLKEHYVNDLRNGTAEYYDDDGDIMTKCSYKNDKLEGPLMRYRAGRKLYELITYKNGKREGPLMRYYDNGQLYELITYKNGKREGPYEEYYDNGQLKMRGSYKDDVHVGLFEEYYENGQLRTKCIDKNGKHNGPFESYYENGQLKMKCTFKDGYKNGSYESYHESGQLFEKCAYKDGEYNGPYESYYRNGQLFMKNTYKDGYKNGSYESYHENGQLKAIGAIIEHKREGLFEEYYDNGQLRKRCTYKNGEAEGQYEAYHYNGQLWERSTYKDGKLDGLCEGYDKDGQLDYRYTYKDGKKVE